MYVESNCTLSLIIWVLSSNPAFSLRLHTHPTTGFAVLCVVENLSPFLVSCQGFLSVLRIFYFEWKKVAAYITPSL